MDDDRIIVVAEIQRLLGTMDNDQLNDVLGFIQHCQNVEKFTCPREKALIEIKEALKSGYSF
jgi:hypothetical protein